MPRLTAGSGGTVYGDYDQSYAYDNLGRMTSASDVGLTGITFTWDALSRQTSQVDWNGTTSSAYDLAGRRTRLTHPDGF